MSQVKDLEKLAELKKKGIITQEEFEEQKKSILSNINFGSDEGSSIKLSPFGYYKLCWKKYIQFSGRASRPEYWWFWLFNFLIGLVLGFFSGFFGEINPPLAVIFGGLSNIYSIAVLLPSFGVYVRRYHDIGKSAWFAFSPIFIGLGLAAVAVVCLAMDYERLVTNGSFAPTRVWIFILAGVSLIIISVLWNFVFPCFASQKGPNKYGPQP